MAESTQHKLDRVRAPRVHITYDVETGGAIETKELPFVMGVLADLSGQPTDPLPKLKERKFVDVTPDNFDSVLKSMRPRVALKVDNLLSEDPEAGQLGVDLSFESLDDFSPDRVAERVPALKKLLDLRTQLADLRGSLQGNEKLDDILQATLSNEQKLNQLREEIGPQGGNDGEE